MSLVTLIVVATGLLAWTVHAHKRPNPILNWPQRVSLAILILALPIALDRIHADWQRRLLATSPEVPISPVRADQLNIPNPRETSFTALDVRVVDDQRVLMLTAPNAIKWDLGDDVRKVDLSFGMHPAAYAEGTSNGVDLIIEVEGKVYPRRVYYRRLIPATNPADRGRLRATVALPAFEPGAKLVVRTALDETENAAWDWFYLGHLRLVRGDLYDSSQFPGFARIPSMLTGDTGGTILGPNGKLVLFIGTPSHLEFPLQPNDKKVEMHFGFFPTAYDESGHTNGIDYEVTLNGVILYQRRLEPKRVVADRGTLQWQIELPPHKAGDILKLNFGLGPNGDGSWDQIFIEKLQID